jgi:hypothetical protein
MLTSANSVRPALEEGRRLGAYDDAEPFAVRREPSHLLVHIPAFLARPRVMPVPDND